MASTIIPKIQFIFFDAGGGHRSAATALLETTRAQHPHWHIDLVNLQEVLKPIDPIYVLSKHKKTSEGVYNQMLSEGWTWASKGLLQALQTGVKLHTRALEQALRRHWRQSAPDLVVSLIPNFNRPMFQSLKAVNPSIPYVTIMTDIADTPPHFWQERQNQYLICGSEKAFSQASDLGYPRANVFQASGMILKPAFYAESKIDRTIERGKIGLTADDPVAMIMFGGNGSKASMKIVKKLEKIPFHVQSLVMCGHDGELREKLEGRPGIHAVGFTREVPRYMDLADVFIGKPGPGSISEALKKGLPVIVEHGPLTMPQERYNTKWVEHKKVGIVVKDFATVHLAVEELLSKATFEVFQRNAKALDNQAVFEIPSILAQILSSGPPTALFSEQKSKKPRQKTLNL